MTLRAESDPRFSRRFLLMGLALLGFSLWCLYDGAVKYPRMRDRGFEEFKSDAKALFDSHPDYKTLTASEFERNADKDSHAEWESYVHERSATVKGGADIVGQYFMGAVAGLFGLFLLSIPLRLRGKSIEASNRGVTSSWG